MNDPWSNLIETLAGNERKTPSGWAQRSVHRIMDDSLMLDPQPRARSLGPAAEAVRRNVPEQRPKPTMRLRCPCTTCSPERARRSN